MGDEERDLFQRHMTGVTRTKPMDTVEPERKLPKPVPQQSIGDELAVLKALDLGHWDDDSLATGDELIFHQPGVQRRVIRKLRKGGFSVRAELDLHGYTTENALKALNEFLRDISRHHQCCIRIVHGKGLRSPGGKPVLKQKVASWLMRRKDVLAFCEAPRHDGGSGAMYVLLARV